MRVRRAANKLSKQLSLTAEPAERNMSIHGVPVRKISMRRLALLMHPPSSKVCGLQLCGKDG
jgi:hypothetical protein